ncbi:hypothetical protein B0G71_3857 [Paraburkholderia sp. BL27I4N3]|nr:hypothetical protein [Paraburkholderia sp. BL27I4N3]REE20719.1 hypothetical protein B0G71_3857 [Paraburkholderia sp. BL27I4N3]
MKMLVVFAVVVTLFFGYMFASAVKSAERANDAVDLMIARYTR